MIISPPLSLKQFLKTSWQVVTLLLIKPSVFFIRSLCLRLRPCGLHVHFIYRTK